MLRRLKTPVTRSRFTTSTKVAEQERKQAQSDRDRAVRSEVIAEQRRVEADKKRKEAEAVIALLVKQFGHTPQQARVDAELILAIADGIGGDTSVDPTIWPVARQRELLERYFESVSRYRRRE